MTKRKKEVWNSHWNVVKNNALCQFSLIIPSKPKKDNLPRLIFETVPIINKLYDWENEITIGMDINEIGSLLLNIKDGFESPIELHHTLSKNEGIDKVLFVSQTENKNLNFAFVITKQGLEIRKINIEMTKSEMVLLNSLLNLAVARMMGFCEYK